MSNTPEGGADTRLSIALTRTALPAYEAALEPYASALWAEFETTDETIEGRPSDPCRLHLYLTGTDGAEVLIEAVRRLAAERGETTPQIETQGVPAEDWAARTQRQLVTIRVGRYAIRGAHLPPPQAGLVDLLIEAGAAFGSGSHQTTQGCLLALERLAKRERPAGVLDLGTGSGILAVAAAKTWPAANVIATDNDRVAVSSAERSLRENGVAGRARAIFSDGYASALIRGGAPYDLIVANILARPLALMAPALVHHLVPGGRAILSGILHHQIPWVLAPHRARKLRLEAIIRCGAWPTLILTR